MLRLAVFQAEQRKHEELLREKQRVDHELQKYSFRFLVLCIIFLFVLVMMLFFLQQYQEINEIHNQLIDDKCFDYRAFGLF